jgi:hypothetical protein
MRCGSLWAMTLAWRRVPPSTLVRPAAPAAAAAGLRVAVVRGRGRRSPSGVAAAVGLVVLPAVTVAAAAAQAGLLVAMVAPQVVVTQAAMEQLGAVGLPVPLATAEEHHQRVVPV